MSSNPLFKYLKYIPYASLPVVLFFPSALTLYWAITAFIQLMVTLVSRSKYFKIWLGVPEYFPGTQLEKLSIK